MYMLYNCVTYGYDGVAGAVKLILDLSYGRQYIIPASWQLAWNGASLVGLVVGGLLSGMVAEKIGKRYMLAIALGERGYE
jgi:hypothetical protein